MNIYDAYFTEMERKTTYVHLDEFNPKHLVDILTHFINYEIEEHAENWIRCHFDTSTTFILNDKDACRKNDIDLSQFDFTALEEMRMTWVNNHGKVTYAVLLNHVANEFPRMMKAALRDKKCRKIVVFQTKKIPPRQKRVMPFWTS